MIKKQSLLKSIIIIVNTLFLIKSIYFFCLCLSSPESFTFEHECGCGSWAWQNSTNFLIWNFTEIIFSSFIIFYTRKIKKISYYHLLFLLTIAHICLLIRLG